MDLVLMDAVRLMNVLPTHITVQMKPHARTRKVALLVNANLDSVVMDTSVQVVNVIHILTTRIRRMGEGNIFTLCISPHLGEVGGYLIPGLDRKGVPHSQVRGVLHFQVWIRGYLIPGLDGGTLPLVCMGDTPSQVWMVRGYPGVLLHPRLDGVPPPPIQDWMGYTPFHPGLDGLPPVQDWMDTPLSRTGWVTPLPPLGDRAA